MWYWPQWLVRVELGRSPSGYIHERMFGSAVWIVDTGKQQTTAGRSCCWRRRPPESLALAAV